MVGLMERAPLRPVPARPAGPVDPAAAVREVAATLPALEPLEVRALALVALADRPRAEVVELLDIEEGQLAALLAAARKELRQTLSPLSGSGWCERAEGLISDRLDGAIGETDGRRLDVHLRNCARCVEHERRLVQATDALLAGIAPARPRPAPPAGEAPLAAVPLGGEELADAAPADLADEALREDGFVGGELLPAGEGSAAEGSAAEASAIELVPVRGVAGSTPAQIAAAADVLVTERTRRQLAAAITWNAMVAIAVILTVAIDHPDHRGRPRRPSLAPALGAHL